MPMTTIVSHFRKSPARRGGLKNLDFLGCFGTKNNTPGNSTWFFLDHPRKFFFFFDDWSLEIPLNSINFPCLDFFWNSTFQWKKKVFISSHTPNSNIICDPDIQNEINMVSLRWPLYIFVELVQDETDTFLLFYHWIDSYVANSHSS